MNDVMVFFAFIGFLAAFVFLLSAIVWIVIVVEDRKSANRPRRKPENYEVKQRKAHFLGSQIRREK